MLPRSDNDMNDSTLLFLLFFLVVSKGVLGERTMEGCEHHGWIARRTDESLLRRFHV